MEYNRCCKPQGTVKIMAKKITFEITEAQLNALCAITDEASSGIGCGDPEDDKQRVKWVRLIDRMLKSNGYERAFK